MFKEYSEKGHTELPALAIIQGGGTVKRENSDRNLMYDKTNLSSYKMVRKDDFIVHLRSFEGGLEKSSLDGIISPAYHTFHSDIADSRFYYPYFRSYEFIKHKLVSHVYGIRDGRSIDIDGMKTIEIPYTSLEEQRKIGDYLDDLDHLITLHQRKLFLNFAKRNDWEQRKVTDLGEIYIGLVTTMTEHYTDQGHLLIRNSDIKDGYFEFGENPIYLDEEFSEQNKSRMHQLGDVITVHTGDIGTSAVIGDNEVNSIGFATIVTRPNQEVLDSDYFATYLNTDTHKQWAISMATGDGRSNYNLKDYTKLVVPIPQIKEQKKIAACIGNLNNLITLHRRAYYNKKGGLTNVHNDNQQHYAIL